MSTNSGAPGVLSIRGLTKTYVRQGSWLHKQVQVRALAGIDLDVYVPSTLAIVGASGCGKSTLARCIAGLERPTSGAICFLGESLSPIRAARKYVQLIFQDPGASLNPRFSVAEALSEPLIIQARATTKSSLCGLLEQVGLAGSMLDRATSHLSGGQKARLAIARALAAFDPGHGPAVLIIDESLGSLDLSVRAQIVNLLIDLQAQRPLVYILITHDRNLAARLADEIVMISEGKIVERSRPRAWTSIGLPSDA